MNMTKALNLIKRAGKLIAKDQDGLRCSHVGVADCFQIKKTGKWEVVLGVTFISDKRV